MPQTSLALIISRGLSVASTQFTRSSKSCVQNQALRHLNSSSRCFADTPQSNSAKQHTVDKAANGDPNSQSYESHAGRKSKEQNTGGTATEQRDTTSSTAKAKKEHPEAPDTIIGMQDERGGKGH